MRRRTVLLVTPDSAAKWSCVRFTDAPPVIRWGKEWQCGCLAAGLAPSHLLCGTRSSYSYALHWITE